MAVFAPVISLFTYKDAYTYHLELLNSQGIPLKGSTLQNWFGVEPLTGRDLFSIVIYGARTSLLVGLGSTFFCIFLGTLVGIIAGYIGGKIDVFLTRFTDVIILFPSLIFMIAIRSIIPDDFPKIVLMILVIGMFSWGSIARVVRSETLKIRSQDYIKATRALGAKPSYILFRHILRNIFPTIIIFSTLSIPSMIGTEAALSFLGVGICAPEPSWGRSIADAINWISVDPLYLLFPGLFLFLITFAFNVLGDFLRDKLERDV